MKLDRKRAIKIITEAAILYMIYLKADGLWYNKKQFTIAAFSGIKILKETGEGDTNSPGILSPFI